MDLSTFKLAMPEVHTDNWLVYEKNKFNFIFLKFKTANLKNGENEIKTDCDECFMTLQDVILLKSKADYFSKRSINLDRTTNQD